MRQFLDNDIECFRILANSRIHPSIAQYTALGSSNDSNITSPENSYRYIVSYGKGFHYNFHIYRGKTGVPRAAERYGNSAA